MMALNELNISRMLPFGFDACWQCECHIEQHSQKFNIFASLIFIAYSVVSGRIAIKSQRMSPITNWFSNNRRIAQKFYAFKKGIAFSCAKLLSDDVKHGATCAYNYRWREALVEHALRVRKMADNFFRPMGIGIRSGRGWMNLLDGDNAGATKNPPLTSFNYLLNTLVSYSPRFKYDQCGAIASRAVRQRASIDDVLISFNRNCKLGPRQTLAIKLAHAFDLFWCALSMVRHDFKSKIDKFITAATGTCDREHFHPRGSKI